jgi:hypothetical protein
MISAAGTRPLPRPHAVTLRNWANAFVDWLANLAESRRAFAITVVCAASLFWLAPRPPMTDLPQHVAQVALWRDLLLGQSPWADLFRINLLTPYLVGYGLALALSFVVSALTAVKIVLTAAFLAFVVSCVQLIRAFGADRRLDWLVIPGFFGFAFEWGFYSFLVAAPVAIQFILMAHRQALENTLGRAAGLTLLGILLLFSHGLMFLFAGLVGGLLLLASTRSVWSFARAAVPYAVLAVCCAAFFVASRNLESPAGITAPVWGDFLERLPILPKIIQSFSSATAVPLTMLMVIIPLRLGLVFSWTGATPLMVVSIILLCAPHSAVSTDYMFQRFAIFVLPFLALALRQPAQPSNGPHIRSAVAALMLACWCSIGIHAQRGIAFAAENEDFERVLAAAEPGRRAAAVVVDLGSLAAGNPALAKYQPSWYQVDKQGLVEFNFAYFHPQVVRYKPDRVPSGSNGLTPDNSPFDWSLPQQRHFDYYFVRQRGATLPWQFTKDPACDVRLVAASGPWSLFERGACKP